MSRWLDHAMGLPAYARNAFAVVTRWLLWFPSSITKKRLKV
jgi:hypothetical protein